MQPKPTYPACRLAVLAGDQTFTILGLVDQKFFLSILLLLKEVFCFLLLVWSEVRIEIVNGESVLGVGGHQSP